MNPRPAHPTTRYGSATVTSTSDLDIVISRRFDAPAALVFRAWTTPELVRRWWAQEGAPLVVCDIDLVVGGNWRYVTRDAGGNEMGWRGTYREIAGPHRLVSTEVFEGYPEGETLNTLELVEDGGVTELRVTVLHTSRANRDGQLASGMERGLQRSLDRVEDIVLELSDDSTIANRYRRVAGRFTEVASGTRDDQWGLPAPCDGWTARDVVRHMVEWMPSLLAAGADVALPPGPSVDTDPVGAWTAMSDGIQALLDDPATSSRTFSHPQAGTHGLDAAIGTFILGDVLVHTWDLARATGQDETLDADEVAGMYEGMLPLDDVLRSSGHYGARVDVPDDADLTTKLIAFTGRRP